MRNEKRARGGSRRMATASPLRMSVRRPAESVLGQRAGRTRGERRGCLSHGRALPCDRRTPARIPALRRSRRASSRRALRPISDRPAGDERQCDRTVASGAPVARGDVAEHAHRHFGSPGRRRSARLPPAPSRASSVIRPTSCLRPARRDPAARSDRQPTKSVLDLATSPASPTSSGVTVPSVSWPTMMKPFLRAQHVHRLGAVGRDAECSPALDHGLPHRLAVVGGTLIS